MPDTEGPRAGGSKKSIKAVTDDPNAVSAWTKLFFCRNIRYSQPLGSDMALSLKDVFQQAKIGQSRSSVLNQLQWTLVILLGGTAAFLLAHAPSWLIVLLAIMLAADFSVFLIAFVYFMVKAPVSLRSETFGLRHLELTLRLFSPDKVAEMQRREIEMAAGNYKDLGDASGLRTGKRKKFGSDPSSPSEGQQTT